MCPDNSIYGVYVEEFRAQSRRRSARANGERGSSLLTARQLGVLNKIAKGSRSRTARNRVLFLGMTKKARLSATRVLANQLQRTLYRVDLAAVMSKYISETEKNLARVFARAEKTGAILVFDEADALFGKRTKVKTGRDRYPNPEAAWLSRRIEKYRGLVVLSPKSKKQINPALLRKFQFIFTCTPKKSSRALTPKPKELTVRNMFPGVYVEELPRGTRTISGVTTSVVAFIGTAVRGDTLRPVRVRSWADFDRGFGGMAAGKELGYSLRQFFENGGSDAWVIRIPDSPGDNDWRDGLSALDAAPGFNLLVLPGVTAPALVAAAVSCCEQRRAFLILDAPAEAKTPDQILQHVQAGELTRSGNAAIYYPWVRIADPLNDGLPRSGPPGGAVAGLFARTDSQRGVWKPPAGTAATLVGVAGLEYRLTDADHDLLNPRGVNCLREFPDYGRLVWGARTLVGDDTLGSEWKYIPVRRLALYLEESISQGIKWAVLEPNDEPLWAQLRLNIGAFMQGLFRQGAFQGRTPQEAYFVKCDRETTTIADLNAGWINILVGFAPLKSAEFIIIRLQQAARRTAP